MRTQRAAQFTVGLALTLLGLLTMVFSWQIKGIGGTGLHSRTFPFFLGCLLTVAALGMVLQRNSVPDEPVPWPDRQGWKRVGVTLASLIVFQLLIEPLGLPIAILIFIAFSVWYLGSYRPLTALALGVVSGFSVWLVFNYLLELSFPLGIFGG